MPKDIARLLHDMRKLQEQLEQLFDEAREKFRYSLEDGRIRVSSEIQQIQSRFRISSWRYVLNANLINILTAPVIYSMIFPLVIVDACFTIYQHICFRAYDIPRVRRSDYLVNDRHKLAYLNTVEKLNCAYCGYGNGVIAYVREIISRTEEYWCPIRHARRVLGAHERYDGFFAYGDAQSFRRGLDFKRNALNKETSDDLTSK